MFSFFEGVLAIYFNLFLLVNSNLLYFTANLLQRMAEINLSTVHLTTDQCYQKLNASEKVKSNIKELQKEKRSTTQNFSQPLTISFPKPSRKPKEYQQRAHKDTQHQCDHLTFQYLSVKLYSNAFLLLLSSNSSSFSAPKITG